MTGTLVGDERLSPTFVGMVLGWCWLVAPLLFVLNAFSLEAYALVTLSGLVVLAELADTYVKSDPWRLAYRRLVAVLVVGFGLYAVYRVAQLV
jgi:hypothetical protein